MMHTRSHGPPPQATSEPVESVETIDPVPLNQVTANVEDVATEEPSPSPSPAEVTPTVPTTSPPTENRPPLSDSTPASVNGNDGGTGAPPSVLPRTTETTNGDEENVVTEPLTLDRMITNLSSAPETTGMAMARATTNNSDGYTNRRRKIIDEFLLSLWENLPKYDQYLRKTTSNVPAFFPSPEVKLLFILLSGPEEEKKKIMILNNMLVDWIGSAKKKKVDPGTSIYHSPSTLNYMLRSFFSTTKEYYNWLFTTNDFNFEGGFNGFFKALCTKRLRDDVSVSIVYVSNKILTKNQH